MLSLVFALNGLAVGVLQLFGMRHLVRVLGKHVVLILGNLLLALGMVGMAFSRQPVVHFSVSGCSGRGRGEGGRGGVGRVQPVIVDGEYTQP